ncbi:hypothetical protein L218DRAFT_995807 [Marasmius fiardii PR-910]|nr:hypothetical protein L218DRAFT_995807 [Marasmius fiardii PR-910]
MSTLPSSGTDSLRPRETPVCSFFAKGRCRFGQNCKKRHILNTSQSSVVTGQQVEVPQATSSQNLQSGISAGNTTIGSPTRVNKPCFTWVRTGSCPKGEKCRYRHDEELLVIGTTIGTNAGANNSERTDSQGSKKSSTMRKGGARVGKEQQRRREEEKLHKEAEEREQRRREAERLQREVEEERRRQEEERLQREAEEERQRQEEERLRKEVEKERRRLEAESKRAEQARRKAERERRRAVEEQLRLEEASRREERIRLEETKVIKHVVLGALISFGAGAGINKVLSGFESCRLRITELPMNAKIHEVFGILRDQGIEEDKFHLISFRPLKGMREANFIVEGDTGRALALGQDGIDFRGRTLKIEASDSSTLDGMRSDDATLFISWLIPSSRFVVSYFSSDDAERKRNDLNGRMIRGRKIKVEFNRLRRTQGLDPYSLLVNGLPQDMTMPEVTTLFEAPTPPRDLPCYRYTEALVEPWLKRHVRGIIGEDSFRFEAVKTDQDRGTYSVHVHFRCWEDAKKVHDDMQNKKFGYIGNSTFRLWLRDPYHITIPKQQYTAQKTRWDRFVNDTKDQAGSKVTLKVLNDVVLVRVGGMDKKAVGMLKVRVESLVAGESLKEMWHTWFGSPEGRRFLERVCRTTGAFVRQDWRLKHMKVFGDADAVTRAQEMLGMELERLSGQEYTETLKQPCIRYFVQHGLTKLKEAFGEDSVKLDISTSPCRIIIRGGTEAHHLLKTLIEESFLNMRTDFSTSSDSTCPICLGEVSSPVKLSCGHEYCTACIRHFFTADINRFPIVCVGDEAKCLKPIALPMIQRFLTDTQFNALLETAFVTHIEQNPNLYRYCKTPDCKQIYACTPNPLVSHCPSCLAPMCTKCHEEGHEGMTCEERRVYANPEEQERLNDEWARTAGVKRCPQCQVWLEKTEGCNHMSCKCGAHICWVCMRAFPSGDQVYGHMAAEHGGFFDRQEPLVAAVDYDAQLRELRIYENGAGVPVHQAAQEERRPGYYHEHVELAGLQAEQLRLARQDALVERARRQEQLRAAQVVRQNELLEEWRRREAERRATQLAHERRRQEALAQATREAEERDRQRRREGGWCTIM